MAEFLLYYRDPERGYEIGDVIHVLPDGSAWGGSECVDDFLVIRIPGMTVYEAYAYTAELWRDTVSGLWRHAYTEYGVEPQFAKIAHRRWKLDINASMSASGIDPDAFGLIYCEDWLVLDITAPVWVDKAAA